MISQFSELPVTRKCRILNVSRSGYYDWRNRGMSQQQMANPVLDVHIQRIYKEHAGRYGYRRICVVLCDLGISASFERIRRRMKRLKLRGIQSRKFKQTTNSKHNLPIKPNLLEQNFITVKANQAWVGDIIIFESNNNGCILLW